MRIGHRPPASSHSASSRISDRLRCEPRLLPATAWISSTITVRVVDSIARPESDDSNTYSDSGVVTRMCGGRFLTALRSCCVVSPVRTAAWISGAAVPESRRACAIPASGSSRFTRMSLDSALSGDT